MEENETSFVVLTALKTFNSRVTQCPKYSGYVYDVTESSFHWNYFLNFLHKDYYHFQSCEHHKQNLICSRRVGVEAKILRDGYLKTWENKNQNTICMAADATRDK